MDDKKKGVALVISAASGTGKSTLVKMLTKEFSAFTYSVSCTTRSPRVGEVDGRDYHFLSRDAFKAKRSQGYFAEWAEVHGNFYGTPLEPVRTCLNEGRDMIFDIDVQGAMQLRDTLPQAQFIFLLPPGRAELVKRLESRGTDDQETIMKRLANGPGEIEQADLFDYQIVNDDLDAAYDRLRAVYLAAGVKRENQPGLVKSVLERWG